MEPTPPVAGGGGGSRRRLPSSSHSSSASGLALSLTAASAAAAAGPGQAGSSKASNDAGSHPAQAGRGNYLLPGKSGDPSDPPRPRAPIPAQSPAQIPGGEGSGGAVFTSPNNSGESGNGEGVPASAPVHYDDNVTVDGVASAAELVGAAEVSGVAAVGSEGDAGGSTHRNRREKGGKNAALASVARAQPGSSDGSAPSRPSRENAQPNLSTTGRGVGIAAASAAGANDASSEEGREEESNDGFQRKAPPEPLAAGQGAASNLRHEAVGFFRQFAMLPIDQWPVEVRRRLESPGNVLGPFVAALPETARIRELASAEGNDVAYFDSDAHELEHVCFAFANNFASDKNDEAVGEEGCLLWKNIHGLVGEKCLRTQLDLLKNIAVEKYNVPGENADCLVPACTAFLNRTMVRGRYDLHSDTSTRNDYDKLVARTDALTCEVMRKLVQLFADGAGLVVCGDPSYEAVIGEAWLKGLGLLIPQTGPVAHPAKACMHWSPQQECVTAVDVCNTMMASALGRAKALITEEEALKLMPWCSIEGGLAAAKKKAKDADEFLWAQLECEHCGVGVTTEGSVDSLSRPKKCNGGPGARYCRGRPVSSKCKNSHQHKKWKVLKIIECLNCCKGDEWAMKELAEYDGCFCYDCKPDHPANRKRKHLEEREGEKAAKRAKRDAEAAEKETRAAVYRPLLIAAIESRANQAGTARTLKKIVQGVLGEQFHGITFNSLLRKMVHDGELMQNKSSYACADVAAREAAAERREREAAERREREAAEEAEKQRKAEKEAEKQRKAEEKEERRAREAAEKEAKKQREAAEKAEKFRLVLSRLEAEKEEREAKGKQRQCKAEEKQRIAAEKEARKQRIAAEKEAEKEAKKHCQQAKIHKAVESGQEHTGRWTNEEHEAFLSALQLYGKEWKKVAARVKTRTVVQTRTHAQKYFQKCRSGRPLRGFPLL